MKRQDLLSRVLAFFTPQNDRFTMKVLNCKNIIFGGDFQFELDSGEQDPFVMAFGQKKATTKQVKELLDLSTFTSEKKNTSVFNLPARFFFFQHDYTDPFQLCTVLGATRVNLRSF